MKKLSSILFISGICVIIAGILGSFIAGYFVAGKGITLVVVVPILLLSFIAGGGLVSVSGSITEAQQDKDDDLELLSSIIEKIKNEETDDKI